MKVKRIVANIQAFDVAAAERLSARPKDSAVVQGRLRLGRVVPVLNPWHQLDPRAFHLAPEVRQGSEHRLAGLGARAREA